MSIWKNLAGTLETVFRIGKGKASLDAGALTAARTLTLPDLSGMLSLVPTIDDTEPASPFVGQWWLQPSSGILSVRVPLTGGGATWFVPIGQRGTDGAAGIVGGAANLLQYNNAGALGGAANLAVEGGNLRLLATTTPAAPTDGLLAYAKMLAGRPMAAILGATGAPRFLQDSLARSAVARWVPAGNGTTITADGAAALSATGTATAANVATTNRHTWMRRLDYLVTPASTTAVAGFRAAAAQWGRGASAGDGGFFLVCLYGPATGVATATHRSFVGMSSSTSAPTDVEPSSLTNILGFGYDAADANIQFMRNDGSGTATKIDLGASFPVPTADRTKAYEAVIYCPPNGSTIYYEFTDLATGAVASGNVTTDIPSNTTLLAPRGWMSVGGTSSVIGIALMGLYIGSDF